jgi:predicted 3-demethylubiquinone-9 3-methyltransferase (glyoxalase superfamily)
MHPIYPCLWFDNQAEEAAGFYTSIFENSRILDTSYYGENMPLPAGTVLTVTFELNGRRFMALNGGPEFHFSEAISLMVPCETQAELDRIWDSLLQGGEPVQCGWLKDKYGLCWQVVPANLDELIGSADQAANQRVLQALMGMIKLDIAALRRAYDGAD